MTILIQNELTWSLAMGADTVAGGAERQQWLMAKALARMGVDVVVYAIGKHGDDCGARTVDSVTLKRIPCMSRTPVSLLKLLSTWKEILKRERPDWCYQRCADHSLGPLVKLAHLYHSRVAYGCASDTDCIPHRAMRRRKALWPLYAHGLRCVDRIIIQHSGQMELLNRVLRHKAIRVPSIASPIRIDARHEPYVSWVGGFRELKRPHLVAELARRLPNLNFVVCGPTYSHRGAYGYGRRTLQLLRSAPNVEYRGQLPGREAAGVIARSAVLLCTSSIEGFPNTFLHAWSAGIPVMSIGPALDGLIIRERLGFQTSSVDSAAKTLPRLVEEGLLGGNAERYRRYVELNHSENVAVRSLLAAFS